MMTRAQEMLAVCVAILTSALALSACSTSVAVTRRDRLRYEGAVEASDCESVTVRSDDDRLVHRVDRQDIIDIDRPGNVHAVIGGLLVADSIFFAVRGIHTSSQGEGLSDRDVNTGLSVTYGLVGVPLLIYGGVVYMLSRRDTNPRSGCRGSP